MTVRYTFDPRQSRFTAQAFATGVLSYFAHSPTFAARDFKGGVRFDGEARGVSIDLTVNAASLEILDNVSASDRKEIEDRMRREVLETSSWPEITFEADDVATSPTAPNRYQLRVAGRLSLHGVTRPQRLAAELQVSGDRLRLLGECPVHLSDYRIRPVSALGGSIKLKDEVKLSFDLTGLPEGP
jgi:polyisoprenoid-binding protein YceI